MLIFEKKGIITALENKTNIFHQFIVPENISKIKVYYTYSPKNVEDDINARLILNEAVKKYNAEILNPATFLPVKNLVTLSFDECGNYRGACHRQANEQTIIISENNSTPGIINRKIEAGKWNIVLNVHFAGCNINYMLQVYGEE